MQIHFKHFKLISAPKPYGFSWISTKEIKGFKFHTPKHLFGFGISFRTLEK